MHVAVIAYGSRGDAEPFIALGQGLLAAGHQVRIVADELFADLVTGTGLEFRGSRGASMQTLARSEAGQEALRHARNPIRMLRRLADLATPVVQVMYEDTVAALDGVDAVLCPIASFAALDATHQLGIPVVHTHLQPRSRTREYPVPAPYLRTRSLTPAGNRLSYDLDALLQWMLMRGLLDRARQSALGLAAIGPRTWLAHRSPATSIGEIIGVSPHVIQVPADWPSRTAVTGYWWRDVPAVGDLDARTRAFLDAGEPPVFFGLGSMVPNEPEALVEAIVGAASDAGVRIILQQGWGDLGRGIEAPHVHVIEEVAHSALFDHVAAVVCHAGSGTMGRALLHGRPLLATPVLADQFYWGRRVEDLGVGPAALPLGGLKRPALAERLRDLRDNQRYARTAGELGRAIAAEDGRTTAAAAVGRFLAAA